MSDRMFYVGAQNDKKQFTGYVPAKFLTLNGKPVVDPTPRGSQNGYIYADGSNRYKTSGEVANPKQLAHRTGELHGATNAGFRC
jgi:hypothetical protein